MDQSFSAGVGNWVADEILYQSRVHPACPVGKLSEEAKEAVWREMKVVVDTAVEVNANHAKFPKGECHARRFSCSCGCPWRRWADTGCFVQTGCSAGGGVKGKRIRTERKKTNQVGSA